MNNYKDKQVSTEYETWLNYYYGNPTAFDRREQNENENEHKRNEREQVSEERRLYTTNDLDDIRTE